MRACVRACVRVCVRERVKEKEREKFSVFRTFHVQAELERLQQSSLTTAVEERGDDKQPVSTASRSPYAKIVTENERLRKELKKVRL